MSERSAPQGAPTDAEIKSEEETSEVPEPEKAEAALSEGDEGEAPTIEFRGITLTLPESLPATLAFDFARVSGGNAGLQSVIMLLTSMLGDRQIQIVRNKIGADGDEMAEIVPILNELTRDVFGAYGLTEGESPASDDS